MTHKSSTRNRLDFRLHFVVSVSGLFPLCMSSTGSKFLLNEYRALIKDPLPDVTLVIDDEFSGGLLSFFLFMVGMISLEMNLLIRF